MELVKGVYAHTVDKVIGSSYDTVRYVAENLEYIKHVSAHLKEIFRVSQSVDGIDALLEHIQLLDDLYKEIDAVLAVAKVTDEIAAIGANLPALMAINAQLSKLLIIYDNLTDITIVANNITNVVAAGKNITAIITLVNNLPMLQEIYNNLASLLSMISHFGTRAEMVTYVSTHAATVKGRVYTADGYSYVCSPGSTAIVDLPGLIPMGRVTPYHFNGKGDGVADDAAAINAGILFLYNRSKSGELDMSTGRWLVDSAIINVRQGIQLIGSWNNVGEVLNAEYTSLNSMILLNPLYTINLAEDFSGIKGMVIIKKGIHRPTSVRDMLDMVKGFSGTAITVGRSASGAANDTYVGYCLVIGFMYAYWSDYNERVTIEYLRGDNTNGIYVKRCYDMNHISHCHMWGYLASHLSLGTWQFTVTGAVNNGNGLIRLTTTAHSLVTGDIVTVFGVAGTVEANGGRWTVTVINSTTIDLEGSHFVTAYAASTGVVSAHYSVRHGIAYNFADDVDWGQMDNCFCWGYDIGFQINSAEHVELLNCGADHAGQIEDMSSIGFYIKDCHGTKMIGCKSAATGYGVYVDLGNNLARSMIVTGHDFWGIRHTCFYQASGTARLMDSLWTNGNIKMYAIRTDPNIEGLFAMGNRVTGILGNQILVVPEPGAMRSTIMWNSWAESSSIGSHESLTNSQSTKQFTNFNDNSAGPIFRFRKSKGTMLAPKATKYQDTAGIFYWDFWDGVDRFREAGHYRVMALSDISNTSVEGVHLWAVTGKNTSAPEVMALHSSALYPLITTLALGGPNNRWNALYVNSINTNSIQAPWYQADNPTGNAEYHLKVHGAVPTANIWWYRDGHARWIWNMTNAAEKVPGSLPNSGSDLALGRYADDSHTSLGSALFISRATGDISSVGTYRAVSNRPLVNGGATGVGYMFYSIGNFGIFGGVGAPTLSAGKGSIYLRNDGSSPTTRIYINTTGGTGWTYIPTAV